MCSVPRHLLRTVNIRCSGKVSVVYVVGATAAELDARRRPAMRLGTVGEGTG